MSVETRAQVSQPPAERACLADIVEQLSRFDGPPEQFLLNLLTVQCHIAGAQGGAILRAAQGQVEVLSLYPPAQHSGAAAPVWLAQTAESTPEVIETGRVTVRPLHNPDDLYGQTSSRFLILIPIRGGSATRGLSAFYLETAQSAVLHAARERLELTSGWLSMYEMRLTLQRRQADLRRLRVTLETLVAVNEQERFAASAMTLCNEVASRWQADRVGLGLLKGRYVKLKALSHTEKFSRKQKLVQDIEAAMEECIDQNVEIIHPAPPDATYVSRSTGELCKRHGPSAMVLMPLRQAGDAMAVLMVQRPIDAPFSLEELESLRLACDLTAPRVAVLERHDKWFGAKLAGGAGKAAGWVVGPKHTWAKLVAVAVLAGVLAVSLIKGPNRAEAPFALHAAQRQVVAAPFQGFIKDVLVKPGDDVDIGSVLAVLDTREIEDRLRNAEARLTHATTLLNTAMDARDAGSVARATAQIDGIRAEMSIYSRQISEATISAPIAGTVLSKDWTQSRGASVSLGEPLFEVAPVQQLWAELSVPEDQISDITDGQQGELASVSYPDKRVSFVVERINPVAEVVDQKNVFRVRVRLDERADWMKVGMEGVAKVSLGEDVYIKLWTRRLVNWVRMKLWI